MKLSFRKSKVTEQIYDNNSVVQGAHTLLDSPSIWLYYLNWKYSYNLAIIIVIMSLLISTYGIGPVYESENAEHQE